MKADIITRRGWLGGRLLTADEVAEIERTKEDGGAGGRNGGCPKGEVFIKRVLLGHSLYKYLAFRGILQSYLPLL